MYRRAHESPIHRPHNRSQHIEYERKLTPTRHHTVHQPNKLKVFVKFKPEFDQVETPEQVKYISQNEIQIKTTLKHRVYKFDHVFNGKQGPKEVFDIGCKDIVDHIMGQTHGDNDKNNGLIFMYGNTGTGKTYSMGLLDLVESNSRGIVPDSIRYIFDLLCKELFYEEKRQYQHYGVSISFCQVYMDEVYDLLALQNDAKLAIREDSKTKQPFLDNQMVIEVRSMQQAFQIINIALEKRRVAEQKMNRRSSRGHGIITVNIDPQNGQRPARLCFVDLAGCERLKQSESRGITMHQALHINSSLSSLQTLLMSISEQSIRNYRSSKLTRMLQPYLQKGRINLFVTTTRQSLNAIQFAKRCKGIRFMEKDLRQSTIPVRKSMVSKEQHKSLTKEIQGLLQFKTEAQEKQKLYLSCIQSLLKNINKISEELQICLRQQKCTTKYSFSDIMNNSQLEQIINRRMESYQRKQQGMLEQMLFRLSVVAPPKTPQQTTPSQLQELTQNSQHYTKEISTDIQALSQFIQYRSIYKKQFFTSELKLHLLQQRCNQLQTGISQLVPLMNPSDKRITRKLKQLGIGADTENQSSQRNRPNSKRQKQGKKVLCQRNKTEEEDQLPAFLTPSADKSGRRSAIFIDQI